MTGGRARRARRRLAGVGRARAARARRRPCKRVVELGAGAGLAGLACKVLGAGRRVGGSAGEPPLLQRNGARRADVSVAPFDWMAPNLGEQFDVVLAADCVFWPELFEPLLNAIAAVARPDGTVLVAVTHRLGRTDAFLEKLRRRGWTASARPRRRDAPQNTDFYKFGGDVRHGRAGRRRTHGGADQYAHAICRNTTPGGASGRVCSPGSATNNARVARPRRARRRSRRPWAAGREVDDERSDTRRQERRPPLHRCFQASGASRGRAKNGQNHSGRSARTGARTVSRRGRACRRRRRRSGAPTARAWRARS